MSFGLPALRPRSARFLLGVLLGYVASVAVTVVTSLGYFSGYQGKALDLYFWVRGQARAPEIVLVVIDDAAFLGLNEQQPMPRGYLAGLIRGLRKSGARLIGLDVDLRRPTVPAQDQDLAAALLGEPGGPAGLVVVARTLVAERLPTGKPRYRLRPLYDPALEVASGYAEVARDDDGLLRRLPLTLPLADDGFAPSLALSMLAHLGGLDSAILRRTLAGPEPIVLSLPRWDETRGELRPATPLDFAHDEDWRINFIGPPGSFITIPSDPVFRLGAPDAMAARDNPFRDKIVLVGATFAESREIAATPRGIMTGVEVHAHILHTLLTRNPLRPLAWGSSLLLQFALCLGISALFVALRPNLALGVALLLAGLLALGLGSWTSAHGTYWVDLLTPILAVRVSSGLHDAVERRRIRRCFHQYVGREVAEKIYRDATSLQGQRRTVTILCADLRDFTTLSEGLTPDRVAAQLNEYFPMMVEAIQRHHGIVIDFVGDAVLAVYGAPLENPAHALDAVRTGLAMQAGLVGLNAGWQARGLPILQMGVSIHTGPAFAGNVGAPDRMKYAVVGDSVNLATRVEGLNKELGTTFLITGDTYAILSGQVRVADCGAMTVKGRRQPVRVYEVLGLDDSAGSV
jgi:adenylate cyclase